MDDLIGEFITETSESLAVLDLELMKLEQNPNDQAILGNIFRLVHTIKGTCGFLGLPRLESVAHAGENVLGKIRDGEIHVTGDIISIVLEALDCIRGLIDYLAANGREGDGDDSNLIARLNVVAQSGGMPAPAMQEVTPPPPPVEEKALGGMLTQAELDALEAAFNSTPSLVEGGVGYVPPAPEAAPKASPPAIIKQEISDQVKEKAIKQGLETEPKEAGAAASTQSIRVNLDVLENLMQMVSELVLTRNQLLQVVRHREDSELKAPLQQLSQITSELQDSVMKTRMQPIGNAWSKFPRLIRDLSNELNKKIDLKMYGEATELDRQLLEMIKDPLTHMVRNSCDHGLEVPSVRLEAGKSETGTVSLSAYHEGGHIIIEIKDDGRGLNLDLIKRKIVEKNLATADELGQLSDEQIMQYIFKAGFSTAEKVTSVSGRGVGMDVVRTNIEKIGGTVALTSAYNKGSTFHIKIPLTLAIVSVLLIEASGQKFAIPQINVLELVRIGAHSEYKAETISNASVLRLRGELLPLMKLSDILGFPADVDAEPSAFVVVMRVGNSDIGLVIDRVYDTEEIVVKPVSRVLSELDVYSGNTILGDGNVIMILDPVGVSKRFGERDGRKVETQEMQPANATTDRNASFLVFKAGEGAPKAVPLELVSRLEVINAADIEQSGHEYVVQYRGDLMRLKSLPGESIPTVSEFEAIVFTYDGRTLGLAVDTIVDIVIAPISIKMVSSEPQYLGSTVIGGKTTDVVDVGYLLKDFVSDISLVGEHAAAMRGMRLLVVEDSPFFMKLLVPFLKSAGFEVSEATSADGALSLIESGLAFDVVITDIEMPQMDGFELAARIRKLPRYAHIPILAFTSTINEQFKQRGEKIGMNGLILKTDRAALIDAIHAQIGTTKEVA